MTQHDEGPRGSAALEAAERMLADGGFGRLDEAAQLAWQAHQDGVEGAGRTFASCADRLSLLSGQPQRFGTMTMEHQGDVALAPVDPRTPDEVRLQLGLPPLSAIRAELEETNRDRARARAVDPDALDGLPFARVWHDPSPAALRDRLAVEGQGVWADGDVLTFVCERDLPGAIVGPNFELPMWRVEDLLVLQVRVHRLSEAVLTYGFWPLDEHGNPAFTQRPEPDGRWRGPDAPPPPPTTDASALAGSLVDHSVESEALRGPRTVTVYRPPGHDPSERLPVIYATDGQWFGAYARRLDAAITTGNGPRVVAVAAHAAGFDPRRGGNVRAMEYLVGFDPGLFQAHHHFFVEELAGWAEAELGVSAERERRVAFGCSDGAGHALMTGLISPDRFGHVIAFSAGVPPAGNERWTSGDPPYIQLSAGLLETAFFAATYSWHQFLGDVGVAHHFTERVSGHDMIQWVEELPSAVVRALG